MKKIIALFFALTMFAAFAGCGQSYEDMVEEAARLTPEEQSIRDETEKTLKDYREWKEQSITETTISENDKSKISVDDLQLEAENNASNATKEDLQEALDTLKEYKGHFFDDDDTMIMIMQNALLLKYYYENTDTAYEKAGYYAFISVKAVYCEGSEPSNYNVSQNYTKFANALKECDGSISSVTDATEKSKTVPETVITTVLPTEPPTTQTPTEKPTERITYSAGTYKVGTDIPAGEYCIYCTSSVSGYYSVSTDSKGDSIIGNRIFDYNTFVTIYDGQYLKLSRSMAVPVSAVDGTSYKIDTSKAGTLRVGTDILAGEYKLVINSDVNGYYCVYSSSDADADIVTNDNFEGQTYVTVSDGQYLLLSRCKIE